MAADDALDRGREAFRQQAWGSAYAQLGGSSGEMSRGRSGAGAFWLAFGLLLRGEMA